MLKNVYKFNTNSTSSDFREIILNGENTRSISRQAQSWLQNLYLKYL